MNDKTNQVVQQCQYDIVNTLRNPMNAPVSAYVTCAAHLLSLASQFNNPFNVPFERILEESERAGIRIEDASTQTCISTVWEDLTKLCNRYGVQEFKDAAAFPMPTTDKRDEPETPESIAKLAVKILDIQPEENVADLCCGKGSVMLEMYNAFLTGFPKN